MRRKIIRSIVHWLVGAINLYAAQAAAEATHPDDDWAGLPAAPGRAGYTRTRPADKLGGDYV